MSTILKALRRLEEDRPRSAEAAEISETSAALDASTPSDTALAAGAGTEALRERILAEERANQRPTPTSASADPAAALLSPEIAGAAAAPPRVDSLRRFASVGALALVMFVLGAIVVPALFDAPAPVGDVATEGPAAIRGTASGVAAVAPVQVAAPVERSAPTRGEGSASVVGRAPAIPARPANEARVAAARSVPSAPAEARGAVAPGAAGADDPSRRILAPEPARPAPNGSVAVSALPVAPASRAQPSPRSAPAPRPVTLQAAPPPPAPEPAVELAFVEAPRTPPFAAESPAAPQPPHAEKSAASAPKPAPRARPAVPLKRPGEPIGSTDRPVAKTADATPIERVARLDVPDVTVIRTSWHPDSSRRSARVRVEASDDVLTLKEGDAVGALVIKEISPSAVVFEAGEVEVRRRVGAGS